MSCECPRTASIVAEVPAASLSEDAPLYRRPAEQPDIPRTPLGGSPRSSPPASTSATPSCRLLDDPAIGDRSWIYEQYDHKLFLNTVIEPGNDGSLMRIKGTDKGLAVSTDGDCLAVLSRSAPRRRPPRLRGGAQRRRHGARPYAVVDNLNFGNPEKPEVMWQFLETVEGMSTACEALDVPVVGGNVSFYNETDGVDIYPTPVVGMLGFCDPMPGAPPRLDRAEAGSEVWVVGPERGDDFAGSAYATVVLDHLGGRPAAADLATASLVTRHAVRLAGDLPVVHDISAGGLAVALAEVCIRSGVGAVVGNGDWPLMLDEAPHRFLAVVPAGSRSRDPRRPGAAPGDHGRRPHRLRSPRLGGPERSHRGVAQRHPPQDGRLRRS